MESDPYIGIPEEIYEYRSLEKADLVNKIIEARQEIAELKKSDININDIREAANKKDHFAVANELYQLRMIIKTLKNSPKKELKDKEVKNEAKVNKVPRGRPKKKG